MPNTLKYILIACGIVTAVALGAILIAGGRAGAGVAYRWLLQLISSWYTVSIDKLDAKHQDLVATGVIAEVEAAKLRKEREALEAKRIAAHEKIYQADTLSVADMLRNLGF